MRKYSVIPAILLSLVFFSLLFAAFGTKFQLKQHVPTVGKVKVTTDKDIYHPGDSVELTIHNNTTSTITYSGHSFEYFSENGWSTVELIPGWNECGSMYFIKPSFSIKPMEKYSPNYQWTLERIECISGNENFYPNYTKVFNRDTSKEYWYQVEEGKYRALVPYISKQTNKEVLVYSNTFEFVK